MEGMKFRSMVVAMVVAAALLVPGQADPGSFKDCYIKCYVFCIIEPSQTLCSCTTQCFKNCILPGYSTSVTVQRNDDRVSNANQNYAFCKLGCASSCSAVNQMDPRTSREDYSVILFANIEPFYPDCNIHCHVCPKSSVQDSDSMIGIRS